MAALDNSTTPFKVAITTIVVSDGAGNSLTMGLEQGSGINYSEPGRTVVEAMQRGRHQTTPVIVETGDGNVSGSLTLLISSFKGNANTHPYEVFSTTGNAAGWTPTTIGGAPCYQWVVTYNSTVDDGGSQTATFKYVHVDSREIGEQDGLYTVSVSFTDYENAPTYA